MAVLATTNPTLADVAKSLDPDGSVAKVVEILSKTNEILLDMPWVEGNLPTGHRTTIRSGLPTSISTGAVSFGITARSTSAYSTTLGYVGTRLFAQARLFAVVYAGSISLPYRFQTVPE